MSRTKRITNEFKYYNILQNRCNPSEWAIIAEKAIQQAQAGDSVARKWLSDYLLGPAIKRFELMLEQNKTLSIEHTIDLSILDNDELAILDLLSSKLYQDEDIIDVIPDDPLLLSENTIKDDALFQNDSESLGEK